MADHNEDDCQDPGHNHGHDDCADDDHGSHGHSHAGGSHGHSHAGGSHGHSHAGGNHGHSHGGGGHGHSHGGGDGGHGHSHGGGGGHGHSHNGQPCTGHHEQSPEQAALQAKFIGIVQGIIKKQNEVPEPTPEIIEGLFEWESLSREKDDEGEQGTMMVIQAARTIQSNIGGLYGAALLERAVRQDNVTDNNAGQLEVYLSMLYIGQNGDPSMVDTPAMIARLRHGNTVLDSALARARRNNKLDMYAMAAIHKYQVYDALHELPEGCKALQDGLAMLAPVVRDVKAGSVDEVFGGAQNILVTALLHLGETLVFLDRAAEAVPYAKFCRGLRDSPKVAEHVQPAQKKRLDILLAALEERGHGVPTATDDIDVDIAAVAATAAAAPTPAAAQAGVRRRCGTCNRTELKIADFNACARCRKVYYCSKECQTIAWKNGHKAQCQPATAAVEAQK